MHTRNISVTRFIASLFVLLQISGCPVGPVAGTQNDATSVQENQPPVVEENQPPEISGKPSDNVTVGSVYSFTPNSTDPDGDELDFSVTNKPAWAKFSSTTGRLFGTPGIADIGPVLDIEIAASDGEFTSSIGPFELSVEPIPELPEIPEVPEIPDRPPVVKKYNPGHYVMMIRSDTQSHMMAAINSGVSGFVKRYYWRQFEPAFGVYDFSELVSDLDLAESQGMQMVVLIEDKSFKPQIPTPSYMEAGKDVIQNRKGGYTARRWSPYVVSRFKMLMLELGKRLDSHPALEGVAIQESSLGLDESVLDQHGYSPEKYRDGLVDVLVTMTAAFPRSQVFWYMNFLPGNQNYIVDIANIVGEKGVIMGGPDVLPDDDSLTRLTYPFYDDFRGKMPLFNSMQFNSYSHQHESGSYPTKYWTMRELFLFARDELHVNYLFWTRKSWRDPDDSYAWSDALPVINNNPNFNP